MADKSDLLIAIAKRLATSAELSFRQRERVTAALVAYQLSREELVDVVRARGVAMPDSGVWRSA